MIVRSGFSFRAAYGKLPDLISRLGEIGSVEEAALCDRNSTFGFTAWTKACKDAGIRPVYGVELAVTPALGEKKPIVDFWRFLAKDSLRPLHDLVNRATSNPGKDPSLTYAQALSQEGVFVIAGERLLIDQVPADPGPDFYVNLSPSTPKGLIKRALDRGLFFVANSDNYYPREEDLETYRVALGFRGGTQTYPRHIMSDGELYTWLLDNGCDDIDRAFANRDRILGQCRATMRKASLLKPEAPRPLRALCEEGAGAKGVDLSDQIYGERLTRELDLIRDKAFTDYFLIVADLMTFARSRMVVGPGRGSSCGSLVCYLLGITSVDPIPHDLIFERFLSPDRMDMPDVDLDFSDERRHLIFEYAEAKYGRDRTARLGTVGLFRAQSALNQAGSVLKIPKWKLEKLALIERQAGDVRVHDCLLDTLEHTRPGQLLLQEHPELLHVAGMEGHPNVASQHAAGLLMTDEPLAEYVAIDARTRAAWVDKKGAEDLNLLKIDALGLTQLSIFERCLALAGLPVSTDYLETIPLDDPAAFDVLNRKAYSGVFQFTGPTLKGIADQITADCLEDLVAMTALARPGPMAGGATGEWVKRKRGIQTRDDAHPMLKGLLESTKGIIVYQEDVMRICKEIGMMGWEDVAQVRRAMGLRLGDELFGRFWGIFLAGALQNGLSENEAKTIWIQMESFATYSFNRSHSVAYGIVSYWSMWLKAHYPVEFAAATLDAEPDPGRQLAMLREMHEEGVGYVPIDPDVSVDRWAIRVEADGRKTLVGPLTAIRGIGPAKLREVLDSRRKGTPLKPGLQKSLANAKTPIDTLWPCRHAIDTLWPDLTKANIFSDPYPISRIEPGVTVGEVMVMGLVRRISIKNENSDEEVAKRGKRVWGDHSLNIFLEDDSGECMAKIDRRDYDRLAPRVLEQAKAGKSLYAIKGDCPRSFRMISVKAIRYLGEVPA